MIHRLFLATGFLLLFAQGLTAADPTVEFSAGVATVQEGKVVQVQIRLSRPSSKPVTLRLEVASVGGGIPGIARIPEDLRLPQPVVIAPGILQVNVLLMTPDDVLVEGAEVADLALSAVVGAVVGKQGRLRVTIIDDEDLPTLSWVFPSRQVTESVGQVSLEAVLTPMAFTTPSRTVQREPIVTSVTISPASFAGHT